LAYYTGSPLGSATWSQSDIDQATSIGIEVRPVTDDSSHTQSSHVTNISQSPEGIPTSSSYYTGSGSETGQEAPESPVKYHDSNHNGHDTFSDFVTLVCQEAGQPSPGQAPRSPTKLVSYYPASMFPPAPTPPMARPVSVKMPDSSTPPPINMQISPPQTSALREASPSSCQPVHCSTS